VARAVDAAANIAAAALVQADPGRAEPDLAAAPAALSAALRQLSPAMAPLDDQIEHRAPAPDLVEDARGDGIPGFASSVAGFKGARAEVEKEPAVSAPAIGAQLLAGRIRNSDYPRAARRAGVQGAVFVRFAVQSDGRVGECVVTRSSGHPELDATTCQLIQSRFRYKPARDAKGRAMSDVIVGRQLWWLARNGRPDELNRRSVEPDQPEEVREQADQPGSRRN
jgi:protein TonB